MSNDIKPYSLRRILLNDEDIMLSKFVINLYFYNVLGGFFALASLLNLYSGRYIQGSIAYIYAIPAFLLLTVFLFYLPKIRWTSGTLHKKLALFFLFVSWLFLTAVAKDIHCTKMTSELAAYFLFWDIVPFVCGIIVSSFCWKLEYKWGILLLILLFMFAIYSISKNWGEILYGRYRVTGFAEVAYNKFGLVIGCFSIATINRIWNSNPRRGLKKGIFVAGISITAFIIVIFAGSMGNIISLILTAVIFFLISKSRYPGFKSMVVKIVFISVIAVLCLLGTRQLVVYMKNNISSGIVTENIGKYVQRADKIISGRIKEMDHGRFFYLREYSDHFIKDPVFGEGFGSRSGIRNDPHNFIVELAGETGVVSVILYLALIIPCLNNAVRVLKDRSERGTIFLAALFMLAVFFSSFFSGSVFVEPQMWFLIGFFPVITRLPKIKRVDAV